MVDAEGWVELELAAELFAPALVRQVAQSLSGLLEIELHQGDAGPLIARLRAKQPSLQDGPTLFRIAVTEALIACGDRLTYKKELDRKKMGVAGITLRISQTSDRLYVVVTVDASACSLVRFLQVLSAVGPSGQVVLETTNPIDRLVARVELPPTMLPPFCAELLRLLPTTESSLTCDAAS